jgi:hypothetical protein
MYGGLNLPFGLRNMDTLLASTVPALYGWGWGLDVGWLAVSLPFAFVWIPFLLRRQTAADWMLLACFGVLVVAHLGARAHGLHGFGPRYYFEAFFALYLLTARGFVELSRVAAPRGRSRRAAAWSATVLFVVLNGSALAALPSRLGLYRGYNRIDSRLVDAIADLDDERALIIFGDDNWRDWAMAAPMLSADPKADLAFAAAREDNGALLDFYSDRPVYLWRDGALSPWRGDGRGGPSALPSRTRKP